MTETLPVARVPDVELDRLARLGQWLAASESGAEDQRTLGMTAALRLYFVRELGLPLQAAAEVSVIKGRLFVQSKLLRALAYEQGYRVVRADGWDDKACTAILVESESGVELGRYTFTIDDARRAGLVKDRSAWVTHPARMLWARAAKFVLDDYAPEVTLGLGTTDEAAEITGGPHPASAASPSAPDPYLGDPIVQEPDDVEWWPVDDNPDQPPEPEQAEDPSGTATTGQVTRLTFAFKEHGLTSPAKQHTVAEQILGRRVTQLEQLTVNQASTLITALSSREASTVALIERVAQAGGDAE